MSMANKREAVAKIADAVAHDLIQVSHWGDSSFINLPIAYFSGTFVTVRLDHVRKGIRVSDNGFAFRELESFGTEGSFQKTAQRVAEADELNVNRRTVFIDVPRECVVGAICDVSLASWSIVDKINARPIEQTGPEIEDRLYDRLAAVFGDTHVSVNQEVVGSSSIKWPMSAVIDADDHKAIFQAVNNRANSVYRISAAFHDLGSLHKPPVLVSVVDNQDALGAKLSLLAQAGRVIEGSQSDDVYRKAAA